MKPHQTRMILALMALVFGGFILASAWITEDAYITFRVMDNFVHGHGLRWNIDERVQVYTHPLWLLIQLPIYALTHEEFYSGIALSFVVAMASYLLLTRRYRHWPLLIATIIFLPLISSNAITDYSISGLENPLVGLLTLAFFLQFLIPPPNGGRLGGGPTFGLSLTASLLLLTRFDTLWFILPASIYLLITQWKHIHGRAVMLGAAPLLAWFAFSLFYYGFLFPNTKYAKLSTGIAFGDLLRQGANYYFSFFHGDPASALMVTLAVALTLVKLLRDRRDGRFIAIGLGLIAYLLYILCIGGDFMRGRFFTTAILVSLLLVAEHVSRQPPPIIRRWAMAIAFAVLLSGALRGQLPGGQAIADTGVADERLFYSSHNSLIKNWRNKDALHAHGWAVDGMQWRDGKSNANAVVRGNIGLAGFFAGPNVTLIDPYGLTDALLARLPLADKKVWRIGHFYRLPPEGYLHYRETGDASAMDEDLAIYAQALHQITAGDLWRWDRLHSILQFQRGGYDTYLDAYLARATRTEWPYTRLKPATGTQRIEERRMVIPQATPYRFVWPNPIHATAMTLHVLQKCDFKFTFEKQGKPIGAFFLHDRRGALTGDTSTAQGTIMLPPAIRATGFDTLAIAYQSPYAGGYPATCIDLPPMILSAEFK